MAQRDEEKEQEKKAKEATRWRIEGKRWTKRT